jgi:hypothetical protein
MIPKRWRIRIFNWFGAGKLTLTQDNPQEYKMANTYQISGAGYNGIGGSLTLGPTTQGPITGQTLTLKITPANGGSIVSVASQISSESLYIIADDADFDRELGKIITMAKLKE